MTPDQIAALSVEWWDCQGKRTRADLKDIVDHYSEVYAIPIEQRGAIFISALHKIPAWKLAQRSRTA